MSRSGSILATVVCLAVLLVLLRFGSQRGADAVANPEPLEITAGRVQLVVDEEYVGLVREGTPLDVNFAVVNTGTEKLLLRQAPREGGGDFSPDTFTVEPGHTGEIVAQLSADDLLARGRKHIRFFTSDAATPELWVTVRGTVIRRPAVGDDDADSEVK